MPKVTIDGNSKFDPQETFTKVQDVLQNDAQIKGIDPNIQLNLDEGNLSGTAKGKQFTANFNVKEAGGGASVHITVELPFILTPLKGQVKSIIEKKIEKALS